MLQKPLFAITLAASIFVGCSSTPTDAKGVAIKVCEATKKMDFASIKEYVVPSLHKQIDQVTAMVAMMDSLPEDQKKKALAKLAKLDCSGMSVTDGSNGTKEAHLPGDSKTIILQKIDGKWKISKL